MTPAANNPTPSKPRRWLRPVVSAAAVIALSAATGWGVASLASPAQAPDTAKVRAALKLRLPKTPIDAITCDGLGGLCEVASKSTLFYVDRAAKYLVIGRIYDMEARQDLTAARLLALNPDLLAAGAARRSNSNEESQPSPRAAPQKVSLAGLPANGAITWGPVNGPKVVVFSDFHCGYCKKLEAELKAIGARVEERPISIFGADSRRDAERVLCSPRPEVSLHMAYSGPGRCTGKFVNPITDICWSCLFPISVGGLKIWPSSRPDTSNPTLPVCLCGLRPGIAMGFWEPVRLADVSMKPWCFVNLGGMKLDPGFDIGFKSMAGPSAVGGATQYNSQWHVHWYAYPLIYWMEIVADFLCLEQGSIDILYITEIDPLWQDSELTAIINPEAVLFANPLALAACAADCVAATAKLPTDELFWCAGCQGTMYPLNGNVSATIGHVQASRLALARFSYKLHRELVAWGTMGSKGLCGKYLMPVMRKQQYRFQATNPNPQTNGRYACAPIGASTTFMSAGQVYPAIGEDMGYLVWRKRNCCAL